MVVGAGVFSLPRRFAREMDVVGALITRVESRTGVPTPAFVFQALAVSRPDSTGAGACSRHALRREDVGRATVLGFLSVFAVFASVTIVSYVLVPMGAIAGPRQPSTADVPVPALVMTTLLGQLVPVVPSFSDDAVNSALDPTSSQTGVVVGIVAPALGRIGL